RLQWARGGPSGLREPQDDLAACARNHFLERLLVAREGERVRDHAPDLRPDLRPRGQGASPGPGAVKLAADDPLERHAPESDVLRVALEGDRRLRRQAEEHDLPAAPDGPEG